MCPTQPDEKMDEASERTEVVQPDGPITHLEIRAVLADPGYSADERHGRLNELLTALTNSGGAANQDLIDEIEAALEEHRSEAEDRPTDPS